jgi:hypothetical protein
MLPRESGTEDETTGDELDARMAFRLKLLEAMRNAAATLMTRKRLRCGRSRTRASGWRA